MLLFHPPNDALIQATMDAQRDARLTYAEVGWTRKTKCPSGFRANQWRARIGRGESAFDKAKKAICNYQMLQLGMIRHVGRREPIAERSMVGTLIREAMIYSLNVARIVYVENDLPTCFGFGYGTTSDYPIIGEERLCVSLDDVTGDVTYDIFSFSRPRWTLLRLVLPWLHYTQRRFCRESTEALRNACGA